MVTERPFRAFATFAIRFSPFVIYVRSKEGPDGLAHLGLTWQVVWTLFQLAIGWSGLENITPPHHQEHNRIAWPDSDIKPTSR
jgi:hypothetical protein